MTVGPVRRKRSGKYYPFMESICPLTMCECFHTFKKAMEMPFRAVWVGV